MSTPTKNYKHLGNCQAVDYISNLPDDIICRILSFVPTKSAVKTSILSKRWKYLWMKVQALDFTEMPCSKMTISSLNHQQKGYYKSFVDGVLLHNYAPYLQRLNLVLPDGVDEIYFISWLIAIARRDVHKIRVDLCSEWQEGAILLPTSFFVAEKLVSLDLSGDFFISSEIPMYLPCLEVAHLTGLLFPDDDFLKRFTLGCPVLKELWVAGNRGIDSTFCIESLTLEKLRINRSLFDIDTIDDSTPLPVLVIKTPNLRYLDLYEQMVEHDICDLNSLVYAQLNIEWEDDTHALDLLRKVSAVKCLELGVYQFKNSEIMEPVFPNLTCLRLTASKNVEKLLKNSPLLKTLCFDMEYYEEYCDYISVSNLPEYLPCLESVELFSFEGVEADMELVAYFLKAACALKELKIDMDDVETESLINVYKELLAFPRSSSACQVKAVRGKDLKFGSHWNPFFHNSSDWL